MRTSELTGACNWFVCAAGSPRVTLGALGDSFYEYMLKTYLLTNNTAERYVRLYNETARGILTYMIRLTKPSNLTCISCGVCFFVRPCVVCVCVYFF